MFRVPKGLDFREKTAWPEAFIFFSCEQPKGPFVSFGMAGTICSAFKKVEMTCSTFSPQLFFPKLKHRLLLSLPPVVEPCFCNPRILVYWAVTAVGSNSRLNDGYDEGLPCPLPRKCIFFLLMLGTKRQLFLHATWSGQSDRLSLKSQSLYSVNGRLTDERVQGQNFCLIL